MIRTPGAAQRARGSRAGALLVGLAGVLAVACGAASTPPSADPAPTPDAAVLDAGPPQDAPEPVDARDAAPVDKAAACAPTFGTALTAGFGRVDGTIVAVVQPKDTQCALPNNDHLILQVRMLGAVYRMVVNVQSDRAGADVRVSYLEKPVKLPAPAWAEGWHTGLKLDYVADFGAKSADFTPFALTELSAKVADVLPLSAKVSVYSDTSGGASTHLIHRNDGVKDGAIVLDPEGPSPRALLFRFATQSF